MFLEFSQHWAEKDKRIPCSDYYCYLSLPPQRMYVFPTVSSARVQKGKSDGRNCLHLDIRPSQPTESLSLPRPGLEVGSNQIGPIPRWQWVSVNPSSAKLAAGWQASASQHDLPGASAPGRDLSRGTLQRIPPDRSPTSRGHRGEWITSDPPGAESSAL